MTNIRYWIINIIALNLLLLDILFKKIFFTFSSREYFIFGDILKLKLATNTGIAFGLGLNYYFIIIVYFIIIPILFWVLWRSYKDKNIFNVWGFTFIIVGAVSNLIDRVVLGAVVDYIDLKYYTIFNLADALIFIGAVLIIINNFRKK